MDFPTPLRSSFGVVNAGDQVYVAGGHVGRFHNYSKDRFTAESHVLDLKSETWRRIRPYGSCAMFPNGLPVQGVRLIEHQGRIYGFGGFSYDKGLDYADPSDGWEWYARSRTEVFMYTPATDEWTFVANLPRARSSYVIGKIGDRAYLVGGWDGTPMAPGDIFGRFYAIIEIFNLSSHEVEATSVEIGGPGGPMRRAFTGFTADAQLVVGGGLGPGTTNDPEGSRYYRLQRFDPAALAADQWIDIGMLPRALFSPGMCAIDGTIVLAGGSGYDYTVSPDILLLHQGSHAWVTNSQKPTKMGTFMELIPVGDRKVLVLGGHGGSRKDPDPYGVCEYVQIDKAA